MKRWHLVECAGEQLEVSADKALYWPRRKSLFISDPHFGKASSFHEMGIPVPIGNTEVDLERLGKLVAETAAERLIILGDFFHHRSGQCDATMGAIETWIAAHRGLEIILIKGNHDRRSDDPPETWGIEVHHRPLADPPFLYCHEPCKNEHLLVLCGHIHPAIALKDTFGPALRLPCFIFSKSQALFPAFGSFTGSFALRPKTGDVVIGVHGGELFLVSDGKGEARKRRSRFGRKSGVDAG